MRSDCGYEKHGPSSFQSHNSIITIAPVQMNHNVKYKLIYAYNLHQVKYKLRNRKLIISLQLENLWHSYHQHMCNLSENPSYLYNHVSTPIMDIKLEYITISLILNMQDKLGMDTSCN